MSGFHVNILTICRGDKFLMYAIYKANMVVIMCVCVMRERQTENGVINYIILPFYK